MIARFCPAQEPVAWSPPASEMRVAEENRLSSGITVDLVKSSLESHSAYLLEEIKQTELMNREHISNHYELKKQSELRGWISGIGSATAAFQ